MFLLTGISKLQSASKNFATYEFTIVNNLWVQAHNLSDINWNGGVHCVLPLVSLVLPKERLWLGIFKGKALFKCWFLILILLLLSRLLSLWFSSSQVFLASRRWCLEALRKILILFGDTSWWLFFILLIVLVEWFTIVGALFA